MLNKKTHINRPINQLKLYGNRDYFNKFKKLYINKKLPNAILLTGNKGLGKATLAYHFINYLLSNNDKSKYNSENFSIDENNINFKLINNLTHPNFFLLDNDDKSDNIKIEQVRKLIDFVNKSTYSKNLKIILIDNCENLNLNSSNALLKVLEEASNNTYFFIIHNNPAIILNTIKSRCIEFKFFLNHEKNLETFKNLCKQHNVNTKFDELHNNFYFETPGNLLNYLLYFNDKNIDICNEKLSSILYLVENYNSKDSSELLNYALTFIEYYFNELCLKNTNLSTYYFNYKYKILNRAKDMKKYNLDKKNLINYLNRILIYA